MIHMDTRAKISSLFGSLAEPADFEVFYHQEFPRIYNYFRFRVGNNALAEDLTSETFKKAWRNRGRYRKDLAAFSTWIFTIARRVFVDHLRKERSNVSLDELRNVPTDETTEDVIQKRADFARLTILLSQLAERDRELVALRYGAGLTNRSIAGLTGLSESNVGVILHRAVQMLRTEWDKPE
jgi:RNA polymerase sigma-70 factor (ECF subfamily)